MKSKPNKSLLAPAFTLIEMLVSISMVVIIMTIFIANYRNGNSSTDLTMNAQTTVTDIHLAQNDALGLVKYDQQIPAGGWGIHFDLSQPGQYIVFADLDRPASTEPEDSYPADPGSGHYEDNEGLVSAGAKVVKFSNNIEISSLKIDNQPVNVMDTVFIPPDPKTSIAAPSSASGKLGEITLRDKQTGNVKTIHINFLGLAEVVD